MDAVRRVASAIAAAPEREPSEQEQLFNTVDALLEKELQCILPGVPKGTSGRVDTSFLDLDFTVRDGGRATIFGANLESEGRGTLEVAGYKPVEITWEVYEDGSQDCHIPPLQPAEGPFGLFGLVVDSEGIVVEGARVGGCGGRRIDTDSEGFFIERASTLPCRLTIEGPDSSLELAIPPGPGDIDLGELVLPAHNVAMGINLARTIIDEDLAQELGGWRIDAVTPDSPAALAGLAEGNLITQVNGESVVGVPPAQLLRARPGDRFELELDGERTVQVGTEPLESLHLKDGYEPQQAAEHSRSWGVGWVF